MSKILLAVDTATENCGIALIVDGRTFLELNMDHGQTHSRFVLNAIDSLLGLGDMTLADIDAFGVTRGPGSFTGLRIGISTVKGLAFATGKPMVGVSTLEVLAHQTGGDTPLVCPLLDARRNEIYWRIYDRRDDALTPRCDEQVGSLDQIFDRIDGACMFVGNGAVVYAEQLSAWTKYPCGQAPALCHAIHPATVGQLAWRRFEQGRLDDQQAVLPVYLRKSDAELKFKNK